MIGSIEKRGENKYRLVAPGGTINGKRKKHYKTITAKSIREAEKELVKFVAKIEQNKISAKKSNLDNFIKEWDKCYAETNLKPNTISRYRSIIELYISPFLGHMKLEQIKPNHLLKFYAELSKIRFDGKEGGLSARTISHCHKLLSSILQKAVEWQYIIDNPAKRITPPKVPKKELECYNEEQVGNILSCLKNEDIQHQAIVNLALATGMRRGELMGLEWKDIDFEQKRISINKASYYIAGQGNITTDPKSETSKRVISVPGEIINLLKKHKIQKKQDKMIVGKDWGNSKKVFTDDFGNDMFPQHMSSYWKRFCTKYKIPYIRFHSLRHTSATLLIKEGIHAKTISSRLGHSDIGITMNVYGHTMKKVDEEAAKSLDKYFLPKES